MSVTVDISRYFTPESVAQLLKDSKPVRTPIWHRVFSDVKQHPLPFISRKTFTENSTNVPLIKRGNASIAIYDGDDQSSLFEPQPIAINTILKANDFLNLNMIANVDSLDSWMSDKLGLLRDSVFNTVEALCCQAMLGSIDYSIKIYEGDLGDYKVDFGNLITAPSLSGGLWDGTATIENVFEDILVLKNKIRNETRYGRKIGILAGTKAFYTLVGLMKDVDTNPTKVDLKIDEDSVYINGTKIEYMGDAGYNALDTGAFVPAIAETDIFLFAEDAPFRMNFLAIDDFDANGNAKLEARSLYPKVITQDDPSAKKLLVQSKPFPMPVPLASLLVTVTS